ncbi:MAG: hypothetical protein DRJ35_06925, partial [Thermoprotei archaeon]
MVEWINIGDIKPVKIIVKNTKGAHVKVFGEIEYKPHFLGVEEKYTATWKSPLGHVLGIIFHGDGTKYVKVLEGLGIHNIDKVSRYAKLTLSFEYYGLGTWKTFTLYHGTIKPDNMPLDLANPVIEIDFGETFVTGVKVKYIIPKMRREIAFFKGEIIIPHSKGKCSRSKYYPKLPIAIECTLPTL